MHSETKNNRKIKIVNYNHDFGELVLFASNRFQSVHRWYPLVEGYSSELVRRIIGEQKHLPHVCLDPFGGVGTTALSCQDFGVKCISFENNPFFYKRNHFFLFFSSNPAFFSAEVNNCPSFDWLSKYISLGNRKPCLPTLFLLMILSLSK